MNLGTKHVRVRITADGREAGIHPMYDMGANAAFIEWATALQWNLHGRRAGHSPLHCGRRGRPYKYRQGEGTPSTDPWNLPLVFESRSSLSR